MTGGPNPYGFTNEELDFIINYDTCPPTGRSNTVWDGMGWRKTKINHDRNSLSGSEAMGELAEKINELPPELRQEVEDFVLFLIERRKRKLGAKLRQDWVGALKDYRGQYTSLDLQKKSLEW